MSDLHYSIAKMRSIVTPLLVLLVLVGAHAQTTFNSVWHHPSDISFTGAQSVFELPDGYRVFAYGWSLDSAVGAVYVAKFTFEGELVWQKEHRRERSMYPGIIDPIARISDTCFVAAMTEFNDTIPNSTFIYWFNAEGDTIQTRFLKSDSGLVDDSHGTRQMVGLSDGGFLHCGWCQFPGNSGCITRLDSAGNFLWEQVYPPSPYIYSAQPTFDGGFILGTGRSSNQDRGSIIKTDGQGQQVWRRDFGGHAGPGGCRVIETPDSNYFVPAAWQSTDSVFWHDYQYASLYKYNASGTQLWRKDYFYGFQAKVTRVKPAGSGLYWLAGGTHIYPNSFRTHLLKVDAEGDSLWMRKYYYYGSPASTSVMICK